MSATLLVLVTLLACGTDPEPSADPPAPRPTAPQRSTPAAERLPFGPPNGLVFMPVVSRRPNRPLYRTNCLPQPGQGLVVDIMATCTEQLSGAIAKIGRDPGVCNEVQAAWSCFTNRDQHLLALMKLEAWPELATAVPRVAALRFRAETWRTHTEVREIMTGAHGPALVGDAVARDLAYEALLTVALSRMPEAERTPEFEQAWAEGAYHLIVAVPDPLVQALREYQPQLIDDVTAMVDIFSAEPLPPSVAAAVAAARAGDPLP